MTDQSARHAVPQPFWKRYLLFLAAAGTIFALLIVFLRGMANLTTSLAALLPAGLLILIALIVVQPSRDALARLLGSVRWPVLAAGLLLAGIGAARLAAAFSPSRLALLLAGIALLPAGLALGWAALQERLWGLLARLNRDAGRPPGRQQIGVLLSFSLALSALACLWLMHSLWAGFPGAVGLLFALLTVALFQALLILIGLLFPRMADLAGKAFRADDHALPVLIVSLAAALTVLLAYPIVFGADSLSYWQNAQILSGQTDYLPGIPYRTPAYPVLLLATGMGSSFSGVLFLQAVMAVLIPFLAHRAVRLFHPPAAYPAGLVVAVSAIPYLYMKTVLTETAYMFLLVLAFWLAAAHLRTGRTRDLVLALAAVFALTLLRPSANLLVVVILAAFLLFRPRQVLRYAVALAVFFAAVWGVGLLQKRNYKVDNLPGMTGKLLFFNVYLSALPEPGGPAPFSADLGPATAQMIAAARAELTARPDLINEYAWEFRASDPATQEHFIGRFETDPDGLAAALFADPARIYYWTLWDLLDRAAGPQDSDRLFLEVSLEKLRAEPALGARFLLRNLHAFFWGPPVQYADRVRPEDRIKQQPYALGALTEYSVGAAALPEALVAELAADPGRTYDLRYAFRDLWSAAFGFVRPAVFVLMLLATFFLWDQETRPFIVLAWLVIAYSAAVVCVFNEPLDRYVYQSFSIELMAAVTGLWAAGARLVCRGGREQA